MNLYDWTNKNDIMRPRPVFISKGISSGLKEVRSAGAVSKVREGAET